ncbi:Unknown protein [Striga hermonthica]|uniref:Uncharacterized protein n=1 Tax=Striga hermonthica TaxID=68872 RepID=A0A9N7MJA7_STRHE|nr:Unknown protein [Striga hermonthica]
MEGGLRPETPHRPPPQEADVGCDGELNRSRSDASSLSGENCRAVVRISSDTTPVDGTAWTNEKHNLYLHHLELSFVKQLHYSKALEAQCSDQNQGDSNISHKWLTHVKNAPEQFKVLQKGCWQKINHVKGEPLSGSSPADLLTSLKSKQVYNFKHMRNNFCLPSAKMADSLEGWTALKHVEGTKSHRLMTFSQECSSSDPYLGDLFDLQKGDLAQPC